MRTKNSILNFVASFLPWILLAIIGFFKIRLFIGNFGSELNGLVQLTSQIFTYFGLAELGFGAAITFKFYKLLANDDKEKINSLFNGSIKIYRKIGLIIFGLGILMSIAGPLFINNNTIDNKYIALIFILNAIDYLFIYFLLMPYQTILIADQKKYKVNLILNGKLLIFRLVELLLIYLKVDYLIILVVGIVFNLLSSLMVVLTVRKEYPWLDKKAVPDTSSMGLTKDVFAAKMFKIVFDNTDSVLLAIFKGGLLSVSIYGAYNYILAYLKKMLDFVLNSPLESFGNLFAKDDTDLKKRQYIYNEFFSVSIFLGVFLTTMFFISIRPFISIWINDKYLLGVIPVTLFSLIMFFEYILRPVTVISEANGKFKETKKFVLISAVVNLIVSILLVKKYQISGVLFGTAMAQLLITIPCFVHYVYKNILSIKEFDYYKKFFSAIFLMVAIVLLDYFLISKLGLYATKSFVEWFKSSAILGLVNISVSFIVCYALLQSFRAFLKRILKLRRKNESINY